MTTSTTSTTSNTSDLINLTDCSQATLPYGALVLDLVGTSLSAKEHLLLQDERVGGVILFARNFTSRTQLCALTQSIHATRVKSKLPQLLIAVDHEGGRVQRFKTDGFTHLPTMAQLGTLARTDLLAAQQLASQVGFVLAAELLACGVHLSFTPVLDLDYGVSSVIGDRAFSSDVQSTSLLARALISGLHRAGMRSCGKHFPGHGFVAADSHHEIPVDNRSLPEIMALDARPYSALNDVLDSVMPAHVIYPQVDPLPAGFSKTWLNILRTTCGFMGVAFSDDLSMAGATVVGDIHARATAALTAGCDMVLVCNAPELVDTLLAGSALSSARTPQHIQLSHQRIARLMPTPITINCSINPSSSSWDNLMMYPAYQQALQALQTL